MHGPGIQCRTADRDRADIPTYGRGGTAIGSPFPRMSRAARRRREPMSALRRRSCRALAVGGDTIRGERDEGIMIKLYYAPHTCSLASHIALEEAGAEYSAVRIDFAKQEQRGEQYIAINPKGRVPAMATDRGILTETPAMLALIAQTFPRAGLAPVEDAFAFAQ